MLSRISHTGSHEDVAVGIDTTEAREVGLGTRGGGKQAVQSLAFRRFWLCGREKVGWLETVASRTHCPPQRHRQELRREQGPASALSGRVG